MVRLPASLKKTMLHYDCLAADATPLFLRQHFGKTSIPHPCLGLEVRGRAAPLPAGASALIGAAAANTASVRLRPPASRAEAKSNAIFLLEAASADLGKGSLETYAALVGLPLLPLADGSLGRFLAPPPRPAAGVGGGDGGDDDEGGGGSSGRGVGLPRSENTVFVCTRAERRLLAGGGLGGEGSGAGHRLLQNLEELGHAAKVLLNNRRVHAATNVAVMEPRDLAGMLGAVFPEAWQGLSQVAWAPGSRDVSPDSRPEPCSRASGVCCERWSVDNAGVSLSASCGPSVSA